MLRFPDVDDSPALVLPACILQHLRVLKGVTIHVSPSAMFCCSCQCLVLPCSPCPFDATPFLAGIRCIGFGGVSIYGRWRHVIALCLSFTIAALEYT